MQARKHVWQIVYACLCVGVFFCTYSSMSTCVFILPQLWNLHLVILCVNICGLHRVGETVSRGTQNRTQTFTFRVTVICSMLRNANISIVVEILWHHVLSVAHRCRIHLQSHPLCVRMSQSELAENIHWRPRHSHQQIPPPSGIKHQGLVWSLHRNQINTSAMKPDSWIALLIF